MVNYERQMKEKEVQWMFLDGKRLTEAYSYLEELTKKYPNGIIKKNTDEDSFYLSIFAEQAETDKEMQKRIAFEEERERLREKRELLEYERLKKKFG